MGRDELGCCLKILVSPLYIAIGLLLLLSHDVVLPEIRLLNCFNIAYLLLSLDVESCPEPVLLESRNAMKIL